MLHTEVADVRQVFAAGHILVLRLLRLLDGVGDHVAFALGHLHCLVVPLSLFVFSVENNFNGLALADADRTADMLPAIAFFSSCEHWLAVAGGRVGWDGLDVVAEVVTIGLHQPRVAADDAVTKISEGHCYQSGR